MSPHFSNPSAAGGVERRRLRPRNNFTKNHLNLTKPVVQYVEDAVNEELEEEERLMKEGVEELQRILGYRFSNPALLEEALTHSSYPYKRTYQRLEFVGDSVIGLVFAIYFFLRQPELEVGRVSTLRAANVSTEKLARVAVRHGLYRFIRHNSATLSQQVREFVEAILQQPEERSAEVASYGGCVVKAPKVLADLVESVAAAVFVDCNFDLQKLWTVIRGFMEPIITDDTHDKQPVTTLYEICQSQGKVIEFKYQKNEQNKNLVSVLIDDQIVGMSANEHRDIAKLNAARAALQKLLSEKQVVETASAKTTTTKKQGSKQGPEAKKLLYELCMKKRWPKPVYKLVRECGPRHQKKYICSVEVTISNRNLRIESNMKSKVKDAENVAAYAMLTEIERMGAACPQLSH